MEQSRAAHLSGRRGARAPVAPDRRRAGPRRRQGPGQPRRLRFRGYPGSRASHPGVRGLPRDQFPDLRAAGRPPGGGGDPGTGAEPARRGGRPAAIQRAVPLDPDGEPDGQHGRRTGRGAPLALEGPPVLPADDGRPERGGSDLGRDRAPSLRAPVGIRPEPSGRSDGPAGGAPARGRSGRSAPWISRSTTAHCTGRSGPSSTTLARARHYLAVGSAVSIFPPGR